MTPKVRVVVTSTAAIVVLSQFAFLPMPAHAASGTAFINGIRRDPGSTQVPVTGGCLATNGRQHTAQLFLRGPGPSTNVVFSGAATVDPFGNLTGSVTVPADAVAGSTFTVSAQCTEPGQVAGVESARLPLPSPGQSFMSFDQNGLPGPPTSSTTVTTTTRGTGGTTTGRAAPITKQPQFAG